MYGRSVVARGDPEICLAQDLPLPLVRDLSLIFRFCEQLRLFPRSRIRLKLNVQTSLPSHDPVKKNNRDGEKRKRYAYDASVALLSTNHPGPSIHRKTRKKRYIYSAVCDEIKTSLFSQGEGCTRKWYGWWKERVGGVSSRSRGAGITIILGGSGSSVSIKKSVRPSVHPSAGRYWGMQGSG